MQPQTNKATVQMVSAAIVFVALSFISILWVGYVASKMWEWFVAPFFGLPELGVLHCYGVILTLHMFLIDAARADEEKNDKIFRYTVVPAFVLFIGYFVKMAM